MIPRRLRLLLTWAGIAAIAAFTVVFAASEVSMSGNESGRFAVIEAVGEQGVFFIENTGFRTVDSLVRSGHLYSDKPLALPALLGAVHSLWFRLTGLGFQNDYASSIYRINLLWCGAVGILIYLWLFNQFRRRRHGGVLLKWALALAAVFGSWLLSYGTMLNNHTPAALAALGIFIMLVKYERRPSVGLAAAAGAAAGVLGALDIPSGAIFAAAAFGAVCTTTPAGDRRRAGTGFLLGLGGMAAAQLALNFAAYGSVLPLYIAGGNGSFHFGWHKNFWAYAGETLFGRRGLFSHQPFLLLAVPVIAAGFRSLTRAERWLLAATAAVIVFYVTVTDEYGGAAYGFRYLIVVIPILWLLAGRWLLRRGGPGRWRAALAAVLIGWGVVAAAPGVYAPFCLTYEGYRSPEGHFTRTVRSPFFGNLFALVYEQDPESALSRSFISWYGRDAAGRFLKYFYLHTKRLEPLPGVEERFFPERIPSGPR